VADDGRTQELDVGLRPITARCQLQNHGSRALCDAVLGHVTLIQGRIRQRIRPKGIPSDRLAGQITNKARTTASTASNRSVTSANSWPLRRDRARLLSASSRDDL
jgi:hypothetical protein